jgi:hypothetical protein
MNWFSLSLTLVLRGFCATDPLPVLKFIKSHIFFTPSLCKRRRAEFYPAGKFLPNNTVKISLVQSVNYFMSELRT